MHTRVLMLALLALAGAADSAAAQRAGAVEGTLAMPDLAARKWASRYPGAGKSTGELQGVPAVVWLDVDLPAAAIPDTAVTILQSGERFIPGALAVRTGTVVRFPNADGFYHNVFSCSGPRFDPGRYPPGASREVTLSEPRLVEVYCEIHEFMRAYVLVTDHGFAAVVAEDGGFRIAGVPPGSYTLRAYHPDHGTAEFSVSIAECGTSRVTLDLGG